MVSIKHFVSLLLDILCNSPSLLCYFSPVLTQPKSLVSLPELLQWVTRTLCLLSHRSVRFTGMLVSNQSPWFHVPALKNRPSLVNAYLQDLVKTTPVHSSAYGHFCDRSNSVLAAVLMYLAYSMTQNIKFPCIFLSEHLHLKWSFPSNSLFSLCWGFSFQEEQRLAHWSTYFHISIHDTNILSTSVSVQPGCKTLGALKKHSGRWHSTQNMPCLAWWEIRFRWLIPSTANIFLFSFKSS